ncbi:MAG: TerB family tellurite resistance protein [Dechloromonas sp.]|nr:TerB family tellurite resistance protein [Dechloromonas sp.]
MRRYTNNSPEAGARIVALALMADGAVDRNEVLLLERQNVIGRLGLDDEQFDAIYYEYCADMLASANRNLSGRLELDERRTSAILDEISDAALQRKILRIMLDIVHADQRLSAGEASLIALALERWGMELCGTAESSVPHHCLPAEIPGNRRSATGYGGSHHVATG